MSLAWASVLLVSALTAQAGGLDHVLRGIEASRAKDQALRLQWARKLGALDATRARRAALDLFRREKDPAVAALFLEHALPLPGVEVTMLEALEKGKGAAVRVVGARYFVERRGEEGLGLVLALCDEKTDPVLHRACLVALAGSKDDAPQRAFLERFAILPPSTRHATLIALRGVRAPHVDRALRAALDDSYIKLRGEAIAQLVRRGDKKALRVARNLAGEKEARPIAPLLFAALAQNPIPTDLPRLGLLLAKNAANTSSVAREVLPSLVKRTGVLAWALEGGAKDRRVVVRAFAVRLLAQSGNAQCIDRLFALTTDRSEVVRGAALAALAARRDKRVIPALESRVERGTVDARVDALELLDAAQRDDKAYDARLLALATSPGPAELRLRAFDLAALRGVRGLLPSVPGLLKHSDWRFRAAGIDVAMRVRDKASIPSLIACLRREEGRLQEAARRALQNLTRLYYQDPDRWVSWWEKERDGFVLPPPPPAEVAAKAAAATGDTAASFYGIPVVSERVVYVLDVSGSMAAAAGTGTTRIGIAKKSLLQVLERSPKRSQVGVLFFETEVHPFAKRLLELSDRKGYERLRAFVTEADPRGGTNLHGALLAAFAVKDVDTVFLLSDGDPSEGEIVDPEALCADILRRNRKRRAVIHCVAVGIDSPLLKKLAARSGGRYVRY